MWNVKSTSILLSSTYSKEHVRNLVMHNSLLPDKPLENIITIMNILHRYCNAKCPHPSYPIKPDNTGSIGLLHAQYSNATAISHLMHDLRNDPQMIWANGMESLC